MSSPGPPANPPTNDEVRDAVASLNRQPTDEARINLYRAITQGMLLLGIAQLPPQIKPGLQSVANDAGFSILSSTGPTGERTLLAFTDLKALRARNPQCPFIGMESKAVLEQVIAGGFSALIVNPAGPWAAIPRKDVEDILKRTR